MITRTGQAEVPGQQFEWQRENNDYDSVLKPIWRFLCPGVVGIAAMKKVVRGFRPLAGLLIGAPVSRRVDGEVQGFGYAGVVRILRGPCDNLL